MTQTREQWPHCRIVACGNHSRPELTRVRTSVSHYTLPCAFPLLTLIWLAFFFRAHTQFSFSSAVLAHTSRSQRSLRYGRAYKRAGAAESGEWRLQLAFGAL